MSETVVDLLEVVEVEKHHGQAIAGGVVATKRQRELLLEISPVGQLGNGVEPRHSIDFKLGVAALGDVLNHQNGALAGHAMDRDLKRAIVERFERDDEIDPAAVVGENGGETRELQLREDSGADQFRQDRFHMRAHGSLVRAEAEHLERLVVGQNEAAIWVNMQRPCDMLLSAMSRRAASMAACCCDATTAMKLSRSRLA